MTAEISLSNRMNPFSFQSTLCLCSEQKLPCLTLKLLCPLFPSNSGLMMTITSTQTTLFATASMFTYLCVFQAQLRTMPFIGLEPLCNRATMYKTFAAHSIATSKQFDIIDVPTLQILYIQTTNHKPTDIIQQQQRCPPSSPSPP